MRDLKREVREQNLIHELVIINELFVMEEQKLREKVGQIPELKNQVVNLKKQIQLLQEEIQLLNINQKKVAEKTRIELARKEATITMQKKQQGISSPPSPQGWKTTHSSEEEQVYKQATGRKLS